MMPGVFLDPHKADEAVRAFSDIHRDGTSNIVQRDPSAKQELKASIEESKKGAQTGAEHLKPIFAANAVAFKKMIETMPALVEASKEAEEVFKKLFAARGTSGSKISGKDPIEKYTKCVAAARASAVKLQTAAQHFKAATPAGFMGGTPAVRAYLGYVDDLLQRIHDGLPKLAPPAPPRPAQGPPVPPTRPAQGPTIKH